MNEVVVVVDVVAEEVEVVAVVVVVVNEQVGNERKLLKIYSTIFNRPRSS